MWAVVVLAFCHAQAVASTQVLNILVDPVKVALSLSDTQYSLLQGLALAIFAAILGLPAARQADLGRRRNVVALAVLVWSLGSLGSALAQNFAMLFIARAVVGVGEVLLFPAALSMLYDVAPQRRVATVFGIFGSGGPVGAGVALMGGGALLAGADADGRLPWLGGLEAWRATFAACALFGLVACAALLMLKEPPRSGAIAAAPPVAPYLGAHWRVYAGVAGAFVALSAAVLATASWAPSFLVRVQHMTYGEAGRVVGVASALAACAGAWAAGLAVDWLQARGRRDAALLGGMAVAAALALCVVGAVVAPARAGTLALLCAAYLLLGAPTVLAGLALQQITPAPLRARVMALQVLLVNSIALAAGPTSVALLTDAVFHAPAAVGVAMAVATSGAAAVAIAALAASRRHFLGQRGAIGS